MPRIWADERAVRQIMLNLLTNAIKFTPQGGQVTHQGRLDQHGRAVYRRSATPVPAFRKRKSRSSCRSFGRGSLAQKNADEGTGLGLPIVKGLIDLHGGQFMLKSKVREGTAGGRRFPAAARDERLAEIRNARRGRDPPAGRVKPAVISVCRISLRLKQF